jgi:hypothetical protein
MLDVHVLQSLRLGALPGRLNNGLMSHGPVSTPLCAASGLVKLGDRLFVVADDDNHLACFSLAANQPGRTFTLLDSALPAEHKARKAAKPDFESLLLLPAFGHHHFGALLAIGSGSLPSRQRGALLALDSDGEPSGNAQLLDLTEPFRSLRSHFPNLNIEGAFIQGDRLCLLQRGNGKPFVNARLDWRWADVQAWLCGAGPAPHTCHVQSFELGSLGGVPLSFTDGAALPNGEWLFSAAAEDTPDNVADGACAGSVIGIVDASGSICRIEELRVMCKVEGLAAVAVAQTNTIDVWMVTDADDRTQPADLLFATWQR